MLVLLPLIQDHRAAHRAEVDTDNLLLGGGKVCAFWDFPESAPFAIIESKIQEFLIELKLGLNCLGGLSGLGQTYAKLRYLRSEPSLSLGPLRRLGASGAR